MVGLIKPVATSGDCAEPFLGLHYFHEAIWGRDGVNLGVEIGVRFSDGGSRSPRRNYYSKNSLILLREFSFRAKLMAMCIPRETVGGVIARSSRFFINVEKSSLLKDNVLLEIEKVVASLGMQSPKLVLVVDIGRVASAQLNSLLIKNILTIKEWGVEFALRSSGGFGSKASLLDLDIYDYIFLNMAKLSLPFRSDEDEAEYQALYETMCCVARTRRARFIATNLKSYEHMEAAYALPFIYFQSIRNLEKYS